MELNGDHFRREYLDELRTKTAERLIAPLIQLVVSFREDYEPQGAAGHDASSVLGRVRDTLERFVAIGQRIIGNVEGAHREKLNAALIDVRNAGTHLYNVDAQFVQNTGNKQLRGQTIAAGRAALEAVVRLLVLSDFIDTSAIADRADKVRHHLNETEKADTKKQLEQRSASLIAEMEELTEITRKRVRDLRDEDQQDDLQAAISVLKAATPMLIASSRAFVTHPELEAARLNREYSFRQAHNALDCIN
ncbi:catenin [Aphelenchoides avenae]|nr:catenin [Aphelenchus avenae]